MIKKISFICFLCLTIGYSIYGEQQQQATYTSFSREISLKGEKISLSDTVLMRYPFRIRQDGDYLYLLDLHGTETFFHIFDKTDYKHIASFGIRGEGPEEVLQGMNIRYVSTDSIWTLDSNKRQICRWKFSPIDKEIIREETIQLTSQLQSPLDFLLYDDATFLIPDYSGKNRLHRVNSQGDIIESIGNIPVRNSVKKEAQPALAQAWRSFIDYHPKKHILVTATQLGDVIEIFNQNTGTHKKLYGPQKEPIYQYSSKGNAIPTGIMGYSDILVTDCYIYAVFHGQTFKEIINSQGNSEDGGHYIHVFDFNGNPVCKYILDYAIYGIHIDEENGTIWATNVNSDDQIVKFTIK